MKDRLLVALLTLITAAYAYGLGWIAWGFMRAGGPLGYGLALGVVILLALTIWVTWREVLFGLAASRLSAQYAPPADADGEDRRAESVALGVEVHREHHPEEVQQRGDDRDDDDLRVGDAGVLRHDERGSAHDRRHDLPAGGGGGLRGAGDVRLEPGLLHDRDREGARG